jgi:hypothetical protein
LITALVAGNAFAAPVALRDYQALTLTASGERSATLESLDPGGLPARPHASVVVRDAHDGSILAEFDPCADCRYDAPAW